MPFFFLRLRGRGRPTDSGQEPYFWSAQGSLLFSSPFALAAKGTHVLAAFNVPQLQGQSGSITVTSDAPYGALTGKAVSVEPTSGLSFDAPMILRSR